MSIHKSTIGATVLTLGLLLVLTFELNGAQPLNLRVVRLPIQSYRLLAMAMDEDGDIWFGSIHHVIHRYTPSTGAVETIPLPQTSANYKLWASQCLAANRKIYILGQAYPKLVIYDRQTRTFSETSYPSPKPDVWFGIAHPNGRHLYLLDRGGVRIIKWDSKTDTGKAIPYPYKTQLPSFGDTTRGITLSGPASGTTRTASTCRLRSRVLM
jgi:hypothetical protein